MVYRRKNYYPRSSSYNYGYELQKRNLSYYGLDETYVKLLLDEFTSRAIEKKYKTITNICKVITLILSYLLIFSLEIIVSISFTRPRNGDLTLINFVCVYLVIYLYGTIPSYLLAITKTADSFLITRWLFYHIPLSIANFFTKKICSLLPNYGFYMDLDDKYSSYKRYLEYNKEYLESEERKKRIAAEEAKRKTALSLIVSQFEKDILEKVAGKLPYVINKFYVKTEDDWRNLSDRDFEIEVGSLYKKLGYEVQITDYSIDGGIDVILKKAGVKTYVQCKHYSQGNDLGVKELREFYGVCKADNVTSGFMVCTSKMTSYAESFLRKTDVSSVISFISQTDLIQLESEWALSHDKFYRNALTSEFLSYTESEKLIPLSYMWVFPHLYDNVGIAKSIIMTYPLWKGFEYLSIPLTISRNGTSIVKCIVVLASEIISQEIHAISINL